jgi:hypothetical protein
MEKKQSFTSPKGKLLWPYLAFPGRDFKGDGKFKLQTKLEFAPGAETDAFLATLDQIAKNGLLEINARILEQNKTSKSPMQQKPALSAHPYTRDENTGVTTVSFSVPSSFTSKVGTVYRNSVQFFDASGKLVVGDLPVGNGSTGRVSFTVYAWASKLGCGVRLEPKGIQVITFQTRGAMSASEDASDYGFEGTEGYSFEPGDASAPAPEAPENAGSAGEL